MGDERHFSSVDRALRGFKARQNLAVLANDMGDLAEAERLARGGARGASVSAGMAGAGGDGVAGAPVHGGRSVAEALLSDNELGIEGLLMKSRVVQAQGKLGEARDALDRAFAERPDDLQMLRERSQFLFDNGTPDEAEQTLRDLINHTPKDAAAHHNLGTLLMRTGRHEEAAQGYNPYDSCRPNDDGVPIRDACVRQDKSG